MRFSPSPAKLLYPQRHRHEPDVLCAEELLDLLYFKSLQSSLLVLRLQSELCQRCPLAFGMQDRASAVRYFIPVCRRLSDSNSDKKRRQRANLSAASARLSIHLRQTWSVPKVNQLPSKYSRIINTDNTNATHSLWVVSYACSGLVSHFDQYPTSLAVLSGRSRNRIHPARTLHVSRSSAK